MQTYSAISVLKHLSCFFIIAHFLQAFPLEVVGERILLISCVLSLLTAYDFTGLLSVQEH